MEPLKDPLNDRTLPSLEPSPFLPLRKELIYKDISQGKEENNDEDRLNYKVIRDHLLKEGKVTKSDFRDIALRVMEMLSNIRSYYRKGTNVTRATISYICDWRYPWVIFDDFLAQFFLLKLKF